VTVQRVMVVDDDPDIRYIAELSLKRVGGFDVVLAGSGEEALGLLDGELSGGTLPDVVLLDYMMPGMTGADVIRSVRARSDLDVVPVVFMTAKVAEREVEEYLALGAAGVVNKPFDPMTLPDLVREIVAGHAD